jgi:predicted aspartyl protease
MKPVKQLKKVFFRRVFYTLIVLQICPLSVTWAQSFTFNSHRKKDAIQFKLIKNLIIIPVYINDKGPYDFILDTGVAPLLITDPTIVDTLDLRYLRSIKLKGLGDGQDLDAFISNGIRAEIGHASIQNISTAILKKDIFNLSNYVGMHIYGLIGFDFFNSFVVKINYPAKRLAFYLPDQKAKRKGEKIPIKLISNKPYISAQVNLPQQGLQKLNFIVDIGASHALSLESYNDKAFPLPPLKIKANLGMGIGGHISGYLGRVKRVKVGNYEFNNVLTSFPDYEDAGAKLRTKTRNGNLGADILKHFHLTFDYPNSAMYLKPNKFYKNEFEHDMCGMEIYLDERIRNRYFVGKIEPGSPAEVAGILSDDEIVSVNLMKIDQFSLDDLTNLFKSGNDRRIIVEIFRKNVLLFKVVKLKIRI